MRGGGRRCAFLLLFVCWLEMADPVFCYLPFSTPHFRFAVVARKKLFKDFFKAALTSVLFFNVFTADEMSNGKSVAHSD